MERQQRWMLLGGIGAGAGAGLMYLLDPERGGRRRSLARGKAVHALSSGGGALRRLGGLLGATSSRRAVNIQKTINVNAPVEDVFAFWAQFENFPRFMANVREVRRSGDNRWRWVVRGPAGSALEWDAELTTFEPDRVLAWRSLPGAVVGNAGTVHFTPNGDGSTQIHIQLSYDPPAGALGHGVATLLGRDPKAEMDEDLVRFKSLIEDGKTTAEGETVTRGEIPLGPTEPLAF